MTDMQKLGQLEEESESQRDCDNDQIWHYHKNFQTHEQQNMNKKDILNELEKAKSAIQKFEEAIYCSQSQCEQNYSDFNDHNMFFLDIEEQIEEENYYTIICQYLLQDTKYEQYLNIFQEILKNFFLNQEEKQDFLYFVIVIKLNFEKLPLIENKDLKNQIFEYYINLKAKIKGILNSECYDYEEKICEELENINFYEFLNQSQQNQSQQNQPQQNQPQQNQPQQNEPQQNEIKIRQQKLSKVDYSLILVDLLKKIQNKDELNQRLDELLNQCLEVQKMYQKEIEDQKNKNFYKNKFDKFIQKKFIKKFQIKSFKNNKYNFISQYLIRPNQENKDKVKSYQILLSCFIEDTFNWINLLDFKQQENSKTFKEIQEFLKQKIIKDNINQEIQNYFNNKIYQKFDFIQFMINLIKIYQQIQKNSQQQLDAYLQQLFGFLKSISDMKLKRYSQKMNINFSCKTFEKLIQSDAKPELLNAIQAAIKQPKQFLNEYILDDKQVEDIKKVMKKLKKKFKKKTQTR